MTEPEDTIVLRGIRYWINRPYHPQPQSDHMLPECENPPLPPSYQTVFGYHLIGRRGPEKPVVKMTYDIMARGKGESS